MSTTRLSVLQTFKKLHRTRMKVFAGDDRALTAGRLKINEEFQKNKHVTNEDAIKAMVKLAEDVEKELRTQVIQAREVKPGVFVAKITEDTAKFENIPYDDNAVLEDGTVAGNRPCCQDKAKNN
ncbi:complex III assembly factor LYRM7 [Helicoverpa armigera]|uniref:complex III assembly factor LYRM7 n=1 Tax=Helicoverpa armigera TaxID=29058 RepID=UPI000B37A788|nr:complex III assembly factor LYRM7 [Helicoverpa armigera]XP_047022372.1 complex III assembly factor LYRM7 [Helicoverpa zea]